MIRSLRIPVLVLAGGLVFYGPAASASELPALAPLESFSEVIERPLFTPDRKRHIKAAPAAPAGKPVLTAIIMLKDRRYAVLRGQCPRPARERRRQHRRHDGEENIARSHRHGCD